MKLKNIICGAVTAVATLLMATSAFAASNFDFGEPVIDEGYVGIPVIYNTTDYDGLRAFDFTIAFSSDKYAFDGYDSVAQTKVGRNNYDNITIATSKTAESVRFAGYANPDVGVTVPNANGSQLFVAWFEMKNGTGVTDDFTLTINEIAYNDGSNHDIELEHIASYTTYTFNKDDDSHGYVYALNATLTSQKDSSKTATVPLTNYYLDDDGNYVFVLKIVGSETDVVDIVINGMVSKKANAAESEWTEEKIDTIENVTVRKLS